MARFASGKNSFFISDRSGQRYRYRDMKVEWTGAAVGPDEFDPKHPQLGPFRKANDPEALRNARPDTNNTFSANITFPTFNTTTLRYILVPFLVGSVGQVVATGTAPASPTTVSLTGVSATSAVGTMAASTISSTFDSTSVTLDSSNKTFDEG
jgi:hypothetical protein|tara:strand:- start:561 stop:1019 length:459 start_codon:yes stop_codon:yes gene_type:complete